MKTNKKHYIVNYWQKKHNLDINTIYDIIAKNLKISKKDVFMLDNINKTRKIKKDIKKVSSWYPLAYLLKKTNFYWIDFFVNKNTLIPRNDTEVLIDQAIEQSKKLEQFSLIDVWTWSWCIPISIYKNTKNIKSTYCFDISKKALRVCKKNIKKNNLKKKIIPYKSNLLQKIEQLKNLEKDLIITANLPYIKDKDYKNMDKSVIKYEPKKALYWWKKTWFELYERLIMQIMNIKDKYNITLFIEIWFDQYMYSKFFLTNLWLEFEYFKDLNNIERIIKISF